VATIVNPGQSLKSRRMGGGLSLNKGEEEPASAPVTAAPEVPEDGSGRAVDRAGERIETQVNRSMDNIDPVNINRSGSEDSTKDKKKSTSQVSVFISEENLRRMKAYKKKFGASVSGTVNAALTQLFDQFGV
jgi:hypothetical protein